MEELADFARRAAGDLAGEDPIFVVSDFDDADPLAAPFLAALEATTRKVGYACLWTEIVETTSGVSLAQIALQYVEDEPRTGWFVALLSAYRSFAEVRTFVMRFLDTHSMDRILVLCATGAGSLRQDLAREVSENLLSRIEIVEGGLENCTVPYSEFPEVVTRRRAARREARKNAGTEPRAVANAERPRGFGRRHATP